MGQDIKCVAEVKNTQTGNWEIVQDKVFTLDSIDQKYNEDTATEFPFYLRNYAVFGFLSDCRNYSESEYLASPRGLPEDVSEQILALYDEYKDFCHTESYLVLSEFLAFDYDSVFEDRRDGGILKSYRDFLGTLFLDHLATLQTIGASDNVRIVFWFY